MKKQKRVDLRGEWVVRKKLTPTELQKLIILCRSAGLRSLKDVSDSWYLERMNTHPYFGTTSIKIGGEINQFMDMYPSIIKRSYTHTELIHALVRKIAKSKTNE